MCLNSREHAYHLPQQPTEDWQDKSFYWIKNSRYNKHMFCTPTLYQARFSVHSCSRLWDGEKGF